MTDKTPPIEAVALALPTELERDVAQCLEDWRANDKVRRLWNKDTSLWTSSGEDQWLGWLDLAEAGGAPVDVYKEFAKDVQSRHFEHVVVCGMGGSSLCPEVLRMTFGTIAGFPELHVLDSTDPAQIRLLEERLALAKTLFIVSSKSGSTLEPKVFKAYFQERLRQVLGRTDVGDRFVAVTDPGSALEKTARTEGFAHVFHGVPSVGGRYSALSHFGMIPGAAMGLDVTDFLKRAGRMAAATSPNVAVDANPGVELGAVLGAAARRGIDKLTLVTSPGIYDLGAWLEQLVAESTGKDGIAIIPVDREKLGAPEVYGDDRLFVYVRLESTVDPDQEKAVDRLVGSEMPVVTIPIKDVRDLGQELFRWEIATAVASSILGIHPFDQPDVEASKIATKKLTAEYERSGRLPEERPLLDSEGICVYTDDANAAALGRISSLEGCLRAHLALIGEGDYFAILAYLEMSERHETILQSIRHRVRDAKRVATCLGFGPRFLHSTGQAYKGGPNNGVFLQLTCDDAEDLAIPGHRFSFGTVKTAQARGDFEVLVARDRRALRLHLGASVKDDLLRVNEVVEKALS